jgi:hypothetical protein
MTPTEDEPESNSDHSSDDIMTNYEGMRHALPNVFEGPNVDPEVKAVLQSLSTQLASVRERLKIREGQMERLVDIHVQHKERFKSAARASGVRLSQLPQNPSLLLRLNNSFHNEVVKFIVSLDSVSPMYLPASPALSG